MAIIDVLKIGTSSKVKMEEEILTDGSTVYTVYICQGDDRVKIDCINHDAACKLFNLLGLGSYYLI